MSLPAMHTAVGMSFPFLAGVAWYARVKRVTSKMLATVALLMLLAGGWAEIPDMPRFLPEKYRQLEQKLTEGKYGNIFFFHKVIDTYQSEDRGLVEGSMVLFFMFFAMLFAASNTISKNAERIKTLNKKRPFRVVKEMPVFDNIVDIHCHVLPGIDDGPKDIGESIRMCKKAASLGIKHIVATPHMPWRGRYETEKIREKFETLNAAVKQEGIPLKLSLGADIRIEWDLVELLKNGDVYTLAGTRYFLLELDENTVPDSLEGFLAKCLDHGYVPIITHPERNLIFQTDINRLKKIHEMGVLIQVTGASFMGMAGAKAGYAAFECLKNGIIDIISSDAHSSTFRLDEFFVGLSKILESKTLDEVYNMVSKVPQMVLNNQDMRQIRDPGPKNE